MRSQAVVRTSLGVGPAVTATPYGVGMADRYDLATYEIAGRDVPPLYGRALRFVLVDLIRGHGTVTVAELVTAVEGLGYPVPGRMSKTMSDALRWEVARWRVIRVGRGIYRIGRAPFWAAPDDPARAPWENTAWLWTA